MPDRPPWRARRKILLAALAVVGIAGVVLAPRACDELTRLYFSPALAHAGGPAAKGVPHERGFLPAVDGQPIETWWFPATADRETAAVVVVAHGNGGNLSRHWRASHWLASEGFHVLMFDYRGFGRSPGSPTRRRAGQDLGTVLEHARRRAEALGLPVALLGQSIGCAVALEVAPGTEGLVAVVVDSPFASWPAIGALHLGRAGLPQRVVQAFLELAFLPGGPQPVERAAALGSTPLLVIAGTADEICPPAMARDVARAAAGSVQLVELPGADHVGLRDAASELKARRAIAAFLRDCASSR